MIGNDIVDLERARLDSNWQRSGFLRKLFTIDEQRLIHSSNDPELMVWTLWSMKESVYKLIVRQTGRPFFAPQKLVCHSIRPDGATLEGSVFYEKNYQTRSIITTRYVASVASPVDTRTPFVHRIVTFDSVDYRSQHERIRRDVKQFLAAETSTDINGIHIQKNGVGIPSVSLGNSKPIPISLSHHGYYGSFAIPVCYSQ
ncbi:hypothetical protein GCM10028807_02610 [Spirosoma daeguense]